VHRTARVGSAALLALLLVACGDSDDGGGGDAAPESTTTTTAAARPSSGCDAAPAGPVREEERTLQVAGAERRFLLTVPEAPPDEPLPLVLDIHGLAEGAEVHAGMTQFSALAEQEGFAVAFPHGTGSPVRWDTGADPEANDDLVYMAAVLDAVEEAVCVDESRVYATGLSMGAMMSSTLACTMADRIAAIGPVAGLEDPDGCDPGRPVPVLAMHGTADPILLFNGGVGDALGQALSGGTGPSTTLPPGDPDGAGYPANARAWAERNGCEPEPADEAVSEQVTRRVYRCPDEGAVEFVVVDGGGHSWPSSEFSKSIERIVGPTTFDIDATEEVWRFFERFRLPAS
jgi:polyhydroxybutyrate depolymerase